MVVDKVIELIKSEGTPRPGVREILEFFKAKSLPMAVASSSSTEIITTVVDAFNIRPYLQEIYSAEHEHTASHIQGST